MAYTIQFAFDQVEKRDRILAYLNARIAKDGRFKATLTPIHNYGRKGTLLPAIRVKPVRLAKKKPYCGNHPGECIVNPFLGPQKKKNATYLEWDDWVKFHNLVNKALNRFRACADVWSTPRDVKGKMWIRKGIKARVRYDYDNYFSLGREVREWNPGTEDQFQ